MYALLQNISEQRLTNIQAAAQETQLRLRDYLRGGLHRLAENAAEITEQLRRRLIDNQAPGLAYLISQIGGISLTEPNGKQMLVAAVSKIYTISQSILNISSLSPEWQNEILLLSGVSFPQSEVLNTQPVNDLWMALAVISSSFNSMTMIKTWYVGRESRRFACTVEYVAGNHISTRATPGACYQAKFHFFPGIHSMRVLHNSLVKYATTFAPVAWQGIQSATRIIRKALTNNPFMTEIPLILSGVRLAKSSAGFSLCDQQNQSMPISISHSRSISLMAYTGGHTFSAFAIFHEYSCEIISVWAHGQYYVLQ